MHIVAICLACAVAAAGVKLHGWTESRSRPAVFVALVTLIGLAVPLWSGASGPQRWVALGPVNLYMAPVVLPAFLVAFAVLFGNADCRRWFAPACCWRSSRAPRRHWRCWRESRSPSQGAEAFMLHPA